MTAKLYHCPVCRLVFSETCDDCCPRRLARQWIHQQSMLTNQDRSDPDTSVQNSIPMSTPGKILPYAKPTNHPVEVFHCIRCGKNLFCPDCGDQQPLAKEEALFTPRELEPHRGLELMVYAVLCFVVPLFLGIVVGRMAKKDLKKMSDGRMDAEGALATSGAEVCGILSILVNLYLLLIVCTYLFG